MGPGRCRSQRRNLSGGQGRLHLRRRVPDFPRCPRRRKPLPTFQCCMPARILFGTRVFTAVPCRSALVLLPPSLQTAALHGGVFVSFLVLTLEGKDAFLGAACLAEATALGFDRYDRASCTEHHVAAWPAAFRRAAPSLARPHEHGPQLPQRGGGAVAGISQRSDLACAGAATRGAERACPSTALAPALQAAALWQTRAPFTPTSSKGRWWGCSSMAPRAH